MANADGFIVLKPESRPGPLGLLEPPREESTLATALELMASYCTKDLHESVEFAVFYPDGTQKTMSARPNLKHPDRYRISKENRWTRKSS